MWFKSRWKPPHISNVASDICLSLIPGGYADVDKPAVTGIHVHCPDSQSASQDLQHNPTAEEQIDALNAPLRGSRGRLSEITGRGRLSDITVLPPSLDMSAISGVPHTPRMIIYSYTGKSSQVFPNTLRCFPTPVTAADSLNTA
jgi:hypothetical protein